MSHYQPAPIADEQPRWYVLRYKNLSNAARERLRNAPIEVFLPLRTINHYDPQQRRIVAIEEPIINSYVFVRGMLPEAWQLGQELGYYLWRRHTGDDSRDNFITIHDEDMRAFRRAAELLALDFRLYDPAEVDLQQDDEVVFLDGELEGVRGYLKTQQGRKGGFVVVPLALSDSAPCDEVDSSFSPSSSDSTAISQNGRQQQSPAGSSRQENTSKCYSSSTPSIKRSRATLHPNALCYAIQARPEQLGVVAFAPGNRHLRDQLLSQKRHVDRAEEELRTTGQFSPAARRPLLAYLRRFAHVQLDTALNQAHHQLMLYRIYALLGLEENRRATEQLLVDHLFPALGGRTALPQLLALFRATQQLHSSQD